MNANLSILQAPMNSPVTQKAILPNASPMVQAQRTWNLTDFAQEQIGGLVRRVFLAQVVQPPCQVVFSAVDSAMDTASICRRTGQTLAAEGAGKVCVVEAELRSRALEASCGRICTGGRGSSETAGAMQKSSHQISPNLWLVPGAVFLGPPENAHSALWLRGRLEQLRREFDYAVIHGGAVATCSATALLAHLADGLVLGIEAQRTRRIAARRVKDLLESVNVRLLGVVLSERQFPIPEGLYRKL